MSKATHKSFPCTSGVRFTWRVKLPFYVFLHRQVSQCLLVQFQNAVWEFLFSCNEVGAIFRPNNASDATIDNTTSKWKAQIVRQVEQNPHRFSLERLAETQKSPKKLIPVLENGGDLKASFSRETSVIIGVKISAACKRLQLDRP